MSRPAEPAAKRHRVALILLNVVIGCPLFGLCAEQLPIAKFDERGRLSALRSGETWADLTANVVIPIDNWKKNLAFRHFAKETTGTEDKRVWTGIMKEEERVGFKVTQAVWREDGKLVLDVTITALASDRNDGAYYSCTLPTKRFGGWRYKCDGAEGTLPKVFKGKEVFRPEKKVARLEFADSTGQITFALSFPEGASLRIVDSREWERTYYWLAICFHQGQLTKGKTAHLRMSIDVGRTSPLTVSKTAPTLTPVPAPEIEAQPIPEEKLQKEAEELIRDFFKDDFDKKDLAGRAALAKKLLAEARLTNTDMDLKFVLLREARIAALDGGHVELALQAVDATGVAFVYDAAKEKTALLARLAGSARTPEAAQNVTGACLDMAEDLIEKERYPEVQALVTQAETAARNVKDKAWQKEVTDRVKRMRDLLSEYNRVAAAFKKLEGSPDDPTSNAAVGRFLCFVKGKWPEGLKHMAKGSDDAAKRAALAELAGPESPGAQAKLGQDWWQYAKIQSGRSRSILQEHAVHWLQKALPGLEGEQREQVTKTVLGFYMSSAEEKSGIAFDVGNVALSKNGAKLMQVGEGGALTRETRLDLIDGITTGHTLSTGYTHQEFPCAWVLTLPKTYLLQELRLLLWDGERRFYRYGLETSRDGKKYELVADCSKGEWRSWQAHRFPPRLVKYIRLRGLYNSANNRFHAVELEAYCAPPGTPVKPKYPSDPKGAGKRERKPVLSKPK